jgi:hypothetical protein
VTGPEASPDFAKAQAPYLQISILLPVAAPSALHIARCPSAGELLKDRGSPPGAPLFLTLSVLRI